MVKTRERNKAIIRSLLWLTIMLVVLGLIRSILLVLPGIDSKILSTPITSSMIVNVVIGILMMLAVFKFGREIEQPTKTLQEPSHQIQRILTNLIYLAVLGIAYTSFYPLVHGIIPELMWIYSLAFLFIAVLPIVRVAIAFYYNVDKWVDIVSNRLIRSQLEPAERTDKCPSCGSHLASDAIYCTNCGAKVKHLK